MLGSVASFHIIIYRDGPIPKCKINLQCSMKFLLKLPAGMISCLFNLLTALVFLALRFGHSWACLRPSPGPDRRWLVQGLSSSSCPAQQGFHAVRQGNVVVGRC